MVTLFIVEFWKMVQESAPWLLIGFFIAGVIHSFLPVSMVKKHLSKKGFFSIVKGALFGIPLPLCSCSVIPVSRSLSVSGASKGATAAFMTSTPEIGVDSFLLTQGLLGLPIAFIRIVSAFISALLSGFLVEKYSESDNSKGEEVKPTQNSCCHQPKTSGVCHNEKDPLEKASFLKFFLVELPKDLSSPLLLGFFVSALVSTFFPNDFLTTTGSNPNIQMLVSLLISIPTYVCATASTPIAAALMAKGLSPGATLIFLLAGPATNASTILAAKNDFGTKGALAYTLSILTVTLLMGYFVQNFLSPDIFSLPKATGADHQHGSGLDSFLGILLLGLLLIPLLIPQVRSLFLKIKKST